MAQRFWQILQAATTKELLFGCQTIITAIRLRRLVNLHLGITLWHQREEPGLCSVHVQELSLLTERGSRDRSDAVWRLFWPQTAQTAF